MVPLTALWAPILLSAVVVFIVSAMIHMMLPYHRSDYRKLKSEDEVMAALRPFNLEPGDYMLPCAPTAKEMKAPGYAEKLNQGPVAIMTVMKPGRISMTGSLVQWFIYCVVVGVFAAYISSRALPPGADYRAAFRFAGCTAFAGHSLALLHNSIWYKKSWSATFKSVFDGLIYALLTGGVFGWLWPR